MVTLSEYDLYRILREEDGSEAVSEGEWAKIGPLRRNRAIQTLATRIELTDDEQHELRQGRGGCRCQDPGAIPPCSACTEPASIEEIAGFVLARRAERVPAIEPEGWGDW